MKILIIILSASITWGQYAPSASGSTTAAAEINSKPAGQSGAGAASGNCTFTAGKLNDVWLNTTTGAFQACTATNTWGPPTGGGSRILIPGSVAVCQVGTVAAVSGSTPATGYPAATCEADGLGAYAAFSNNSSAGNTMYQRVDLPQDWAGTLKLNASGWSTSTNAATINVSTGCVNNTVTTGITFNAAQALTFTPGASSHRTALAAQSLTTTSCASGYQLTIKYNIVGAAAAALNVLSLQVTE